MAPDEVVITIRGKKQWLWRAVDQEGFVIDVLVQSRAARRLMLVKDKDAHLASSSPTS